MADLKLEIVTPEKKVFDETVDTVTIPTGTGEIGIMPNHAPLISTIRPGVLTYSKDRQTEKLAVAGGFVEVSNNKISVLADSAERADEIDVEAAQLERENMVKTLGAWNGSEAEFEVEKEKLDRAQARLQLAGK